MILSRDIKVTTQSSYHYISQSLLHHAAGSVHVSQQPLTVAAPPTDYLAPQVAIQIYLIFTLHTAMATAASTVEHRSCTGVTHSHKKKNPSAPFCAI